MMASWDDEGVASAMDQESPLYIIRGGTVQVTPEPSNAMRGGALHF